MKLFGRKRIFWIKKEYFWHTKRIFWIKNEYFLAHEKIFWIQNENFGGRKRIFWNRNEQFGATKNIRGPQQITFLLKRFPNKYVFGTQWFLVILMGGEGLKTFIRS